MTSLDHLIFFGLAFVYPIASYFSYQRLMRRVAAGKVAGPMAVYNSTLIGHWTMFAIVVATWVGFGRSWAALGFGWQVDAPFLVGLALTVVAIVMLARQYGRTDQWDERSKSSMCDQLGDLKVLMPGNNNELSRFYLVSASAGIVEETLWRGYMFWYLGHVMPLWSAAVVTSVLFGFAHIYQGRAQVPAIVLVGGVFAGLYLLTGSLWLPIILHAVFDAVQGRAAHRILSSASAGPDEPVPDESS